MLPVQVADTVEDRPLPPHVWPYLGALAGRLDLPAEAKMNLEDAGFCEARAHEPIPWSSGLEFVCWGWLESIRRKCGNCSFPLPRTAPRDRIYWVISAGDTTLSSACTFAGYIIASSSTGAFATWTSYARWLAKHGDVLQARGAIVVTA